LQKIEDAKGKSTVSSSNPINKAVTIKAARTVGGMLFGHELLLTALPFLKRFVKANVKVVPKGTGAAGGPNFPSVPKIGSIPPTSPISAIKPDQGNKPIPKKTKSGSGNGRGYVAMLLAVAACIGLFVFLRNDGVATSQPKNEWETLARSVVFIEGENNVEAWSGSGTLIIDGSYILTNYHIAPGTSGVYSVYFTESFDEEPGEGYSAEFVIGDEYNDLAILRILDSDGSPIKISGRKIINPTAVEPELSEELTIIGYPGAGFSDSEITMTISRGSYSGKIRFGDEYLKTDGMVSGGVSGGAAFNSSGDFVGVPSASRQDDDFNSAVGLIKPSIFAEQLISKVKP
jgi:S1-C subfamily serine protease